MVDVKLTDDELKIMYKAIRHYAMASGPEQATARIIMGKLQDEAKSANLKLG